MAIVNEHIAAIVERLGVVGIKLHGGVGVSKRSVEPAQVAVSVGSLAEGPRVCWIERDGAIEILQRKIRLVDVPVGGAAVGEHRGERFRLILQRLDQCRTGSDALLGRDRGFVAWGADRGIDPVFGAVLRLRGDGSAGQTDGGENRNAPAHDKPFKLRAPSPSKL